MKKQAYEAITTLVGATVGAGILGVPYVIAQSGILLGIIDIIVIGILILIINLYIGEISLRTKENHQFIGFAQKYLGDAGAKVSFLAVAISSYGALIAYLIASGELVSAILGGSTIIWAILFFIIMSGIVYFGIKAVKRGEIYLVIALVAVLIIIIAVSAFNINTSNLTTINPSFIFMPYGVILFSLFGFMAIPEMREELGRNQKYMKKAIIIGTCTAVLITLLFAIVVVGVVGLDQFNSLPIDQRIATIALGSILGQKMLVFANLFALFSVSTSFVAIGYALKEMFHFDYKISWRKSWLYAMSIPILFFLTDVFLIDITNFMRTLSVTGAFLHGLIGILIILIYRKAKKLGDRKPEYTLIDYPIIDYTVMILFALGIIYEITKFIL